LLNMRGVPQLLQMRDWMEHIAQSLHLPGRPHVEVVATFILFNAVLLALVGVAVLVLMLVTLI
jgi:hypothetical protein